MSFTAVFRFGPIVWARIRLTMQNATSTAANSRIGSKEWRCSPTDLLVLLVQHVLPAEPANGVRPARRSAHANCGASRQTQAALQQDRPREHVRDNTRAGCRRDSS